MKGEPYDLNNVDLTGNQEPKLAECVSKNDIEWGERINNNQDFDQQVEVYDRFRKSFEKGMVILWFEQFSDPTAYQVVDNNDDSLVLRKLPNSRKYFGNMVECEVLPLEGLMSVGPNIEKTSGFRAEPRGFDGDFSLPISGKKIKILIPDIGELDQTKKANDLEKRRKLETQLKDDFNGDYDVLSFNLKTQPSYTQLFSENPTQEIDGVCYSLLKPEGLDIDSGNYRMFLIRYRKGDLVIKLKCYDDLKGLFIGTKGKKIQYQQIKLGRKIQLI